MHEELRSLKRKRLPFFERFLNLFREERNDSLRSPEEEMIAAAEREMSRLLIAEKQRLEQKNRKQLNQ